MTSLLLWSGLVWWLYSLEGLGYARSEEVLDDRVLEIAPVPHPVLLHVLVEALIHHLLLAVATCQVSAQTAVQCITEAIISNIPQCSSNTTVQCSAQYRL